MVLLVETERVPSDVRPVTDVGMEEKHSTRRKARLVVEVVVGVVVGVVRRKVVEGQLVPCPFPACNFPRLFGLYGVHRCRFELGKKSYREKRKLAPECGSTLNRGSGVSGVEGQATSP